MEPFTGYIFDFDPLVAVPETANDIPTLLDKYHCPKEICYRLYYIKLKSISADSTLNDLFYEKCDELASCIIKVLQTLPDMWRVLFQMYQYKYIKANAADLIHITSKSFFNESTWAICNLLVITHGFPGREDYKFQTYLKRYNLLQKIRGDPCFNKYAECYKYAYNKILTQDLFDSLIVLKPEKSSRPKFKRKAKETSTLKRDFGNIDQPKYGTNTNSSMFFW